MLYFIGQVILSNLDILLVKHFFPPSEAGIYAAVALVGRVVFMLSWSVVSSMFPVSASHTHRPRRARGAVHRHYCWSELSLSAFIAAVALAPQAHMDHAAGESFPAGHGSAILRRCLRSMRS